MADESKLKEYYSEIANTVNDLIPCEWKKLALYAEVNEDRNFFTFYFEHKEGAVYRWADIPDEYYGRVDIEKFGSLLTALEEINKNFWNECKDTDNGPWCTYSFELDSDWKFKMNYGYEIDESLSEFEREIRWAYDVFGVIPNYRNECNILKKYLKEAGRELPERLMDKEVRYNPKIVIKDTPEKFEKMADELIPFLVDFFRELNELEIEVNTRYNKLTDNKYKLGIQRHMEAPGAKELRKEHTVRFGEIAKDRCTEELLHQGYAGSWSNPPEYGYIDGDCQITFTMKSAKRAVIETIHYIGTEKKHQFVLKLTDDGWRVSEKKYGFKNSTTWYKDTI